jgi:hypothetical protein
MLANNIPPAIQYAHQVQQQLAESRAEYAIQRTKEQQAELERQLGALAHSGRFGQMHHYPRPF